MCSLFFEIIHLDEIQVWLSDMTGIGAGVDSFYEYALKWYILSGKYYLVSSNLMKVLITSQERLSSWMFGMKRIAKL